MMNGIFTLFKIDHPVIMLTRRKIFGIIFQLIKALSGVGLLISDLLIPRSQIPRSQSGDI